MSLMTINPFNHQAYHLLSLSTIKPINHQAYRPLILSTIEPMNHLAYWSSGLLSRLLSLSACFAKSYNCIITQKVQILKCVLMETYPINQSTVSRRYSGILSSLTVWSSGPRIFTSNCVEIEWDHSSHFIVINTTPLTPLSIASIIYSTQHVAW